MILVGNARGGARNLAIHLMKPENEHVEVFELRGFASDSLSGALNEAYALSKAGQCRKFLFSLSLNPPVGAKVTTASFIDAAERAETELGLAGQPRAIVFHEKAGPGGMRRHAHAVWSRIDPATLKAVPLPYNKRKLTALSRDLFIEHGWSLPKGLIEPAQRDPRNFTLAEWQQARRVNKDPRTIKAALQAAWAVSDSTSRLAMELDRHGFKLARGDRRSFVVVDNALKPYALHKWLGLKLRDVRARLGDGSNLPSVSIASAEMAQEMDKNLTSLQADVSVREDRARHEFDRRRNDLLQRQRRHRAALISRQNARHKLEVLARQERFRTGLGGVWDRIRGEHSRIQKFNEAEAIAAIQRDRLERDALVWSHLEERQRLSLFAYRVSARYDRTRTNLAKERARYRISPIQLRAARNTPDR